MGVEADVKAGAKAARANWLFFTVAAVGIVIVALWYDHKNGGKLTAKFAGLPVVGKLFA